MDRFGRKCSLMISTVPMVLGWILIAVAPTHPVLLTGRVLAGISVGLMAAPAQVFILWIWNAITTNSYYWGAQFEFHSIKKERKNPKRYNWYSSTGLNRVGLENDHVLQFNFLKRLPHNITKPNCFSVMRFSKQTIFHNTKLFMSCLWVNERPCLQYIFVSVSFDVMLFLCSSSYDAILSLLITFLPWWSDIISLQSHTSHSRICSSDSFHFYTIVFCLTMTLN